jgi:hypothetical protein
LKQASIIFTAKKTGFTCTNRISSCGCSEYFLWKRCAITYASCIKKSFPQIEKVAATYSEGNDQILVLKNDGNPVKKFKEEKGVIFTEPSFFDILDFKWLAGNPASLNAPNSVVLTKKTADKYFGDWKTA